MKQLGALFTVQLGVFILGGAIGALLPIYAVRMGADPATVGFLLALVFLGMAGGIVIAGWLSDRWGHRKAILIGAGVFEALAILITGQSVNLGQLTVLSVLVTLFTGMEIAMVSTLAGLFASPSERGRVFGVLASAVGLGFLIGGLGSGPVVDRWGFPGLYTVCALVTFVQPLAGLFLVDKAVERTHDRGADAGIARGALLTPAFLLLFFASTLAFGTNGMQGLARSLIMDQQHFSAADITSTVAVSGLVTLPFPLLVGWLSDRLGRKPLIVICYVASALSVVIMIGATLLWYYWVSTALQTLMGASLGVGLALVTDLVPVAALGTGLALFGATNWFGLILGSGLAGTAIQLLGMTPTLLLGAIMAVLGIVLVMLIRRPAKSPVPMVVPEAN
ncbi:MAG TPA: MFS transporter [Aggregatilineales bacterium]|nr:MFS transporter [Aggregatilineales bacterium]